jgi:serine/threonine-protein kinase
MTDTLAVLATALEGRYRIDRELGAGGMATVYLAHDLRHDRQVALKVLRPELAAVLGADRFVQEIKTTASLQHPHILPLFDSGRTGGGADGRPDEFLFYVMPYIAGETLREKLNRETQLGIAEAVRIATEVADALDYAHRHGVIHRDIKPENILLHDGRAMVADFGIALAVSAAAGGRMTETGLSLGTPHYMSPEQATAEKDLTNRSDIYSLGSVLYEMLTGSPPHVGATAQQIIMKIIAEDAKPVTQLRKSVPPNVGAAVAQAIEKLPADRFASAKVFAEALHSPTFVGTAASVGIAGTPRRQPTSRFIVPALTAVAAVTAALAVWGWLPPPSRDADRPVEFYLDPPDSTMSLVGLMLSPDGRRIVGEVNTDEGSALYERTIDARDWRMIPGTERAYAPFFSPDGEWLGFATPDGVIQRIPVAGGAAQAIARVDGMFGATWGPDNTIVFSTREGEGGLALFRVSADGGVPDRLTTPAANEGNHASPYFLPGGEIVLFTLASSAGQPSIAALALGSRTVSPLGPGMSPAADRQGRVIYVTPAGVLVAQRFNRRTLSLEGSPQRLAEGVAISFGVVGSYSFSDNALAYQTARSGGEVLLVVSREGATRTLLSGFGIAHPRFSPAGDYLAFIRTEGADLGDVWVYSLAEGTAQRLSLEGRAADPAWAPDGRSIGYSVAGEGAGAFARLYRRAADGTGSAEQILAGDDNLWQMDFAPRAGEIIVRSGNDLFRATLGADAKPAPLLETDALEEHATLSPDGRWIAYKSNETGIEEIYVRSYPDMGPRTVVSIGGGTAPAWSADGREIFYWGRSRIVAASVRAEGPRLTVIGRTELFRTGPFRTQANRNYDVHPNGREFVMVGGQPTRAVVRLGALTGEQ